MHIKIVLPALALLLATSLTAQTETQKAKVPQGEVQHAAVPKVEPGLPLEFGVTGLTQDNLEQVRQSLTSLTSQVYVCTGCKHEQAKAGNCTACKLDLEAKREPMLLEALPSVETTSIRLIPVATRNLRYSDLEGALMKNSIKLDPAKFPLSGKSCLVLRGGTSEDAKTIEKALMDSKLFERVQASFDSASSEIRVVAHADATAPTYEEVASVIEKLGTKAKLADVVWGPPTTPIKP